MNRAFLISFSKISLVVYSRVWGGSSWLLVLGSWFLALGSWFLVLGSRDHRLNSGPTAKSQELIFSLRPQQQNRHTDLVLHSGGGRPQKHVGKKSVPMSAHGYQIATFLLDPLDDFVCRF